MKQFLAALALAAFIAGCNTSPEEMGSSGVDSTSVSGSSTIDSSTTITNSTSTVTNDTSTVTNGTQNGTSPDATDSATPQNSQSGTEPNGSR